MDFQQNSFFSCRFAIRQEFQLVSSRYCFLFYFTGIIKEKLSICGACTDAADRKPFAFHIRRPGFGHFTRLSTAIRSALRKADLRCQSVFANVFDDLIQITERKTCHRVRTSVIDGDSTGCGICKRREMSRSVRRPCVRSPYAVPSDSFCCGQ